MDRIPAGDRNKRITIERDVGTSQDATGHTTPDWQTYVKRWAKIEPLSGRELWNAHQVQPDTTHKVIFKHYDGITTAMRVKYGTRYFQILSVLNRNEDNVEDELMCKEAG